jgi:hypothetical protein
MTDERPIFVDGSPGYAVYKAFNDLFGHELTGDPSMEIGGSWFDLSEDARDRWEEIAERAYTDALVLPQNGYELSIRTAQGRIAFVWVGACSGDMRESLREAVDRAVAGGAP